MKRKPIQITFDSDTRALYINLVGLNDFVVHKTIEAAEEVFIDLDKNEKVLGVEILNPGCYSFKFIENIANKFKIPQLKQIQHPEKLDEVFA